MWLQACVPAGGWLPADDRMACGCRLVWLQAGVPAGGWLWGFPAGEWPGGLRGGCILLLSSTGGVLPSPLRGHPASSLPAASFLPPHRGCILPPHRGHSLPKEVSLISHPGVIPPKEAYPHATIRSLPRLATLRTPHQATSPYNSLGI